MEQIIVAVLQLAISFVLTVFGVAWGMLLALKWYFGKGKKRMNVEDCTCYDCEHCEVREDNGEPWCYRHGKGVDLYDKACENFVEE